MRQPTQPSPLDGLLELRTLQEPTGSDPYSRRQCSQGALVLHFCFCEGVVRRRCNRLKVANTNRAEGAVTVDAMEKGWSLPSISSPLGGRFRSERSVSSVCQAFNIASDLLLPLDLFTYPRQLGKGLEANLGFGVGSNRRKVILAQRAFHTKNDRPKRVRNTHRDSACMS